MVKAAIKIENSSALRKVVAIFKKTIILNVWMPNGSILLTV